MQNLHWLINPVKNQYFDFEGRATRQQYWMFVLWYIILYVGLSIIGGVLDLGILAIIFSLAIWAPSIAIGARRLHDIGKSGWWQLLLIIPIIGWIILIIWLASEGDVADNEFGPSPYLAGHYDGAAATPMNSVAAIPEAGNEENRG